ncbi:MFS transporter [Streptacidiphilus sp. PB12-B1b]|uniref:MFS transporter n=1 Tax=Streptacidiphilus sp. PB12-B1b TaxID=2705012 RepID=UPI0015FE6FAD|nr:MFS transporter [Streptacidiphilus sp. PB12-B1b]QMU74629.1 MFS transporter [Streptacidiphilus sp. PB12-B1b]
MTVEAERRPRLLARIFRAASWREEVQGPVERRLAAAMVTLYVATGLSFSSLAVYMLRQEHLSPAVYGAGASVAAVLGLLAGPAIGGLADRLSGYVLYACLMWTMAAVTLCLTVSPALVALGLLSVLVMCARGSAAVQGALVGSAVGRDRRLRFRAVVRSMANVAMVVGLGLGAVVLAAGSRAAFDASFVAEAVMLSATGGMFWQARGFVDPGAVGGRSAAEQERTASTSGILRDRHVVALVLLNWLFCLAEPMLTIALPLWVGARMHVPMWIISATLVVNTIGVVLLQVPVARRVTTDRRAARSARIGALLFAISALTFPVAAELSRRVGVTAALAALMFLAVSLVCGDILYSIGSTILMYGLVPQQSYGKSQGIFGMGFDVASLSAPALFGWFAGGGGPLGWYVLGLVFAVSTIPLGWIQNRVACGRPAGADS